MDHCDKWQILLEALELAPSLLLAEVRHFTQSKIHATSASLQETILLHAYAHGKIKAIFPVDSTMQWKVGSVKSIEWPDLFDPRTVVAATTLELKTDSIVYLVHGFENLVLVSKDCPAEADSKNQAAMACQLHVGLNPEVLPIFTNKVGRWI